MEASAEERMRIAADVHDLVMQDLSLALATARMLAEDPASGPHAKVVVEAGERALQGARELVRGLAGEQRGEPIAQAVEASVRAAARTAPLRFQAVGVDAAGQPDRLTVHTLLHVAREAVTNAVKHSGPDTPVEVRFARDDEWRLTVRDSGRGFDLARVPKGFGLESMQARVGELGGLLRIVSAPGQGSTLELSLP
jgi:signal transduction histidine kinase